MAITLYCGRPGSGKSYGVVENVILPAIQKKRPVYTNIPLNIDAFEADYPGASELITYFQNKNTENGVYLTGTIQQESGLAIHEINAPPGEFLMLIPGGAVIVIDECWRYWASGMKSNELPLADKEFFAEHRHKAGADQLTQEIVLVTQTPSQIAKCVKDLIDQTIMTVKADKVGLVNKYQVKIFSACIPSIDRPGEPNQTGFGTYKPEIYKYYKSHTKSETGLAGIEIKADKRGSIWGHWYIRFVAPVVLIASLWGTWYTYKFFTGDAFGPKQPEVTTVTPINQPIAVLPPTHQAVKAAPNPLERPESKIYRVTGSFQTEGKKVVYIANTEGETRAIDGKNCRQGLNGFECIVNGELVADYTGKRPIKRSEKPVKQDLTQVVPSV